MDSPPDSPDLQAALAAAQAEIVRLSSDLGRAEQERDAAVAQRDSHQAEIDRLTLEIKLLRHRLFSPGSERDRRHLDQLELKLEGRRSPPLCVVSFSSVSCGFIVFSPVARTADAHRFTARVRSAGSARGFSYPVAE